jgi:hypothetical protein
MRECSALCFVEVSVHMQCFVPIRKYLAKILIPSNHTLASSAQTDAIMLT